MRIPDETIEAVRSASDIVEVIAMYVPLKKRGKNYLGLCPFHHEKTPSFNVNAEKQMYHCFGCGVGGNVFTFLMEHDKVTFVEAVRILAEKAGILLPAEDPVAQAQASEHETLFNACRMAALFFHERLMGGAEGGIGLSYFRSRGFSDETIRKFGLGYALNGWDGLLRHAAEQHVAVDVLEKAGLVTRREEGNGYYDRFRGRAIFPILSSSGRVIAFGARKLREDDPMAKYLNSPETPIYNKSRNLYGLSHARDAIREKDMVILVEGYADLITVFQAGVQNIVASSGTALTEDQIRLISRYTKSVTLVYDADSAGSKATLRGVDLVIEQGLDVRVAELPEGEDPDSFVRKHGGKAFQALVDKGESFLDFKAGFFQRQGMLGTAEGKTRAIRSIVGTVARMKDELKRSVYIQELASKYGLQEAVLQREVEALLGREAHAPRRTFTPAPAPGDQRINAAVRPAVRDLPASERDAIRAMLEGGEEVIHFVFSYVEPGMFLHAEARRVAEMLAAIPASGQPFDVGRFFDSLPDDALRGFVTGQILPRYEIGKGWKAMGSAPEEPDLWRAAEGAIVAMRVRELDALLDEAQKAFRDAEVRGEALHEHHLRLRALQDEKRALQQAGLPRSGDE